MKHGIKIVLVLLMSSLAYGQGSFGEIVGKVFEKSDSEVPAEYAKIWVEQGSTKFGAEVDSEGRFKITAVPTGQYQLKGIYFTDTLDEVIYANVQTDGISNVGRINILENVQVVEGFDVVEYEDPLINFGDIGQSRISSLDIMQSPVRNSPKQLIASRNSDIKLNDNGDMMIRGARANDMAYFVDGVKTGEINPIPSVAIGGITVYTSAIPAKYGDTTGGVIIMETKSYYDLWRAWKMQQNREH
ncbi:MAG: hypothetical protein COA32_05275 [Fluviicola sp.]|nr:MAG: hypothetical protein COA32_05275 [Fluviicola sp.]